MALQRLALAADAGEAETLLLGLVYEQQRRQSGHLDYLDGFDAARSEHGAKPVRSDKSRPDVWNVQAHFRGLPDGLHLYSIYGRLSENTHAGLFGAAPYLLRALQSNEQLPARPEPVPWAEALALMCWSCWAADDAMRRFLVDGDDRSARHIPLLARVGLVSE